jgi:sigma-B regulation protein RsbQ
MGGSDAAAYDFDRYSSLEAHADDLLAICEDEDLADAIVVGHSIAASIGVLAANRSRGRIAQLVLVSPSPSFLNEEDGVYQGGFSRSDLEGLVELLEQNPLGWSAQMAPVIAGQPHDDPATSQLSRSFCRTDPEILGHFGRVTFFTDSRVAMSRTSCPSLILHCAEDALVSMQVADWMRDNIPNTTLRVLPVAGHCPHMTNPIKVIAAMRDHGL